MNIIFNEQTQEFHIFNNNISYIIKVLRNPGDKKLLKECKNEALAITKKYLLKNIK